MLELYRNIKNRRLELQMTQSDLAKALGYADKSMIAKIEKGVVDLPLSKIELFADALGTTPSQLMGDTWENDIIDNARLEIINHFDGDAFEIAKFQNSEELDSKQEASTIAAHFDTKGLTEDELDDVANYIEFIKSKRKK